MLNRIRIVHTGGVVHTAPSRRQADLDAERDALVARIEAIGHQVRRIEQLHV